MKKTPHGAALALSLLLSTAAAPALAQDTTDDRADRADRTDVVDTRDDDDGFDWGLLGLLGLLGLMPRKRHTVVHHDTTRVDTTGTPR